MARTKSNPRPTVGPRTDKTSRTRSSSDCIESSPPVTPSQSLPTKRPRSNGDSKPVATKTTIDTKRASEEPSTPSTPAKRRSSDDSDSKPLAATTTTGIECASEETTTPQTAAKGRHSDSIEPKSIAAPTTAGIKRASEEQVVTPKPAKRGRSDSNNATKPDPVVEPEAAAEPATRSSARTRKPPTRLQAEHITAEPTVRKSKPQPKSKPAPAKAGAKRPPARGPWSPTTLLTSTSSKLLARPANELAVLFRNGAAWDVLSDDERLELLRLLPDPSLAANLPPEMQFDVLHDYTSSPVFRTDVRHFQEALAAGVFQPGWIDYAVESGARRRAGEFADWARQRQREHFLGEEA